MEKIFKLVKIFLRDRLKLEISEKKSKVVNLRKKYSYFLRVKFKAFERTNKLHYKGSNLQVLNIAEVTLFTLQACKYKKAIKIKIKEKQIGIKEIEYTQIRAILRVQRNSICEVTEKYIGGSDEYHNLMFLNSSFKNLLKSENKEDYYIDDDNYQKILKILSKYK